MEIFVALARKKKHVNDSSKCMGRLQILLCFGADGRAGWNLVFFEAAAAASLIADGPCALRFIFTVDLSRFIFFF